MSPAEIRRHTKNYALIMVMLGLTWALSQFAAGKMQMNFMEMSPHGETLLILFSIVIVFSLGFVVYELSKNTVLPSFVLAIFVGIVARDVLSVVVENEASLTTLITIGAILILFGGGLDTPFSRFTSLIAPISSLALGGTVLNSILLSLTLYGVGAALGTELPIAVIVLLGAALASTDPAAIIPSFKSLLFTQPRVKHIAISESAINDVVGVVLVTIFVSLLNAGAEFTSVLQAYANLLTFSNMLFLVRVILVGFAAGLLGFAILHFWSRWKQRIQTEGETDAALFLAVPLFAFAFSEILGGSGYLSVFIAGLLFHVRAHFRHVEHYFNHTIEGFMKPMIFMLLGAMVDPAQLMSDAGIGIISGLLFMVILRPLVVFISLAPFCRGKNRFTLRELLFLSCVRETGVIPAVLLITIRITGIPGSDTVVAIGLWVILLTLIVEPPLTPYLAKKLCVAKDIPVSPKRKHEGPVAVLCSRGFSFPERMNTVVEWAEQHSVENVMLLHCPEEKYSDAFAQDVRKRADELFKSLNAEKEEEGRKPMNFEFVCGPGLLQENIESLIEEGDVSIIFVGCKMLDYRLEDVKRLAVPFFFMP